jgi:hypothetical protein
MSQEAVPEQTAPSESAAARSVPDQQSAPKGLLQQMEELMAALTADLSQLDADLQTTGDRPPATDAALPPAVVGASGATVTAGIHESHRESHWAGRPESRYDGDHDRSR